VVKRVAACRLGRIDEICDCRHWGERRLSLLPPPVRFLMLGTGQVAKRQLVSQIFQEEG